jgi:acyl-CoA thioesterase
MSLGIDADELARAAGEALQSRDRVGSSWGIEILELRPGFARLRLRTRSDMLNGHDIVHGGILFTLADTALAYAANSRNIPTVTQQASISYLNSAREGDVLIAEAREHTLVGRTGTYDVDVRTEAGTMLAVLHGLTRSIGAEVIQR